MFNRVYKGFLLFTGLFVPIMNGAIAAQEPGEERPGQTTEQSPDIYKNRLDELLSSNGPQSESSPERDRMLPESPGTSSLDQATKEKYLEALRQYYEYHVHGLQHRREVFEWQLFSSKIIFFAVLLVVFSGIYFAAVQFHSGLAAGKPKDGEENRESTEFVASLKGIKVSSPILGVIILVISLVFFYLYLVYVYPIQEIF